MGELLKELQRTAPQDASPNGRAGNRVAPADAIPAPSPYAEALHANRISRQSAHGYERLVTAPRNSTRASSPWRASGVLTLAGIEPGGVGDGIFEHLQVWRCRPLNGLKRTARVGETDVAVD